MAEQHISKFACHTCSRATFILQRNSLYILIKFTRYNTLQEIQYDTHLHPTAEISRANTTFTTRTSRSGECGVYSRYFGGRMQVCKCRTEFLVVCYNV